jgi:predicted metal-dependent peptidase
MSRSRPVTPAPINPNALTDVQCADARTWMQAARVWTIERLPYLDTALTSMLLVESVGLGTVAVDARWRLYYDPARTLALQAEHGIAALASDWVHEVMHLMRDHPDRWTAMGEPDGRRSVFNYAGDAHVNADVAELHLPILDTDVTFDRLPEAGCERAMTTEEIYRRLLPHAVTVHVDCGSGSGGGQRPWEQPIGDEQPDGSVDPADAVVIREDVASKIRSRTDDDVPPALRHWAGEILEPSVDWRIELRSIVSRRLGQHAGVTDYTFTRLARRRVPGFTLPGMAGPEPPHVAVIIDTSGSMTPDEIGQCLAELLGIVRATSGGAPAITVMTVTTEVVDVMTVRRPADVPAMEIRGGGGTDMGAGLEACGALRHPPEVVVVLTDGFTPWPKHPTPSLESATVIALLSQCETKPHVPDWIRPLTMQ